MTDYCKEIIEWAENYYSKNFTLSGYTTQYMISIVCHIPSENKGFTFHFKPDEEWGKRVGPFIADGLRAQGYKVIEANSGTCLAILSDCNIESVYEFGTPHCVVSCGNISVKIPLCPSRTTDEDLRRVYDTIPNCEYLP